ncbi:MAG: nucleoside triphosphate pyrophosphohydrolase [Candidatus Aureabacteria bacterium]|nr:nucleoside triphosphate pyrophosphohydrolase [Candidatus Auribacterota bacterium]
MSRHYYNKLVRDRIPALISGKGRSCKARRLTATAYARALKAKIREEADELYRARGEGPLLNELIDLQELVDAFRGALGVRAKRFQGLVRCKRRARGGFSKRLFLEYTEEP